MKRDMDLIRNILLKIEEHNEPFGWVQIQIEGYTNLEIAYHIKLLSQAKLIEAFDGSDSAGFDWMAISLTWEGHEFLDAAKNNKIWIKAISQIKNKGIELSFDLLKEVLKRITIDLVG